MQASLIPIEVELNSLVPHPKNAEIYGDEDVSDLIESIKKYGMVSPLVITENGVIISGHRRARACKTLGIQKVSAIVRAYETEEDEIADLVNLNLTRSRTTTQMAREATALMEVEKKKAAERQAETHLIGKGTQKSMVVANSPQPKDCGKSRDAVAGKVGFKSGREASRAITAVNKIDELRKKGDAASKEKAEVLQGVLDNRNPSAAEELAKKIDDITIDEQTKEELKTGKKSPRAILNAPTIRTPEFKTCSQCNRSLQTENFRQGKGVCNECQSKDSAIRRAFGLKKGDKHAEVDESLYKSIYDSVKAEDAHLKVHADPEGEYMAFEASLSTIRYSIANLMNNADLLSSMRDETRARFTALIDGFAHTLENLKESINGGKNNEHECVAG